MEVSMELNGDETIAELAALRVAVRRLLEVANDQSVEKAQFGRNALKQGLADLTDMDYWRVLEGTKAKFRMLAQASYRDLFSDL
jgi:CHAD domain-containing protein